MIEDYTNQTIAIKIAGSTNDYNEPTYNDSTIKGRFEYDRIMVRDRYGKEVVSEAVLYTSHKFNEEDLVEYDNKEWPIQRYDSMPNLDGDTEFYEVRL